MCTVAFMVDTGPPMVDTENTAVEAVLVELDERRRASLGRLGRHNRYLAREEPDGTLVFEPAVVISEIEARFLANRELVARIEADRRHPERLRPRRRRSPRVVNDPTD